MVSLARLLLEAGVRHRWTVFISCDILSLLFQLWRRYGV